MNTHNFQPSILNYTLIMEQKYYKNLTSQFLQKIFFKPNHIIKDDFSLWCQLMANNNLYYDY